MQTVGNATYLPWKPPLAVRELTRGPPRQTAAAVTWQQRRHSSENALVDVYSGKPRRAAAGSCQRQQRKKTLAVAIGARISQRTRSRSGIDFRRLARNRRRVSLQDEEYLPFENVSGIGCTAEEGSVSAMMQERTIRLRSHWTLNVLRGKMISFCRLRFK